MRVKLVILICSLVLRHFFFELLTTGSVISKPPLIANPSSILPPNTIFIGISCVILDARLSCDCGSVVSVDSSSGIANLWSILINSASSDLKENSIIGISGNRCIKISWAGSAYLRTPDPFPILIGARWSSASCARWSSFYIARSRLDVVSPSSATS